MPEALLRQEGVCVDFTPTAAVNGGQVVQLPDGRAGVVAGDLAAGQKGAAQVSGIYKVAKATGFALLAGGRLFWDYSANAAHFKSVNDRDFYLGTVVGDVAPADTWVEVALNQAQRNLFDAAHDPAMTTLVGGASITRRGGTHKLTLAATNEAEKVDLIAKQGCAPNAKFILEARIQVVSDGAGSAVDFNVGVASATHATDFDAIAEFVSVQMDANNTQVNVQSDDGVTDVALADSLVDVVEGTAYEVWIDGRDRANVKIYIDGNRVLSGTTFTLAAAAGQLYPIAHAEKTASTDTYDADIDWLRMRIQGE